LVELGKRFARFRKENRPGARIPDELRAAALSLLPEVAASELYRACGISFGQVVAWKEREARRSEEAAARVFAVVDGEPARQTAASTTAAEFEFRFGAWSVSVRQAGRG
jgi:hypothetical protein